MAPWSQPAQPAQPPKATCAAWTCLMVASSHIGTATSKVQLRDPSRSTSSDGLKPIQYHLHGLDGLHGQTIDRTSHGASGEGY